MTDHAPTLLEVVLQAAEFRFGGRDEIEEPLDEALRAAGLGEVTGGGTGMGVCIVDVEVSDAKAGLAILRDVLARLGVAPSTVVNQYRPEPIRHAVYSDSEGARADGPIE